MSRELGAMSEKHGAGFGYRHVQIIGETPLTPPDGCWNHLIRRLDNLAWPWNWVLFLEDDVELPEGALDLMFDRIFRYRQSAPNVVGATYQTWVERFDRGGMLPAIHWLDEEKGFVAGAGWYCLLLERRALEILPRPAFNEHLVMGQDQKTIQCINAAGWRVLAVVEHTLPHFKVDEFCYKAFSRDKWPGIHKRSTYGSKHKP